MRLRSLNLPINPYRVNRTAAPFPLGALRQYAYLFSAPPSYPAAVGKVQRKVSASPVLPPLSEHS